MDEITKKRIKKIIVAVVVIAVVISGIFVFKAYKTKINYRFLYSVMPDSIQVDVDEDTRITVYKRLNADYDSRKDDDMNFMEFYYNDENGEEVVIEGSGQIVYNGENQGLAFIGFSFAATDNIEKAKSIATTVGVIVGLLVTAGLIVLWFFIWSKKQDEEKEKKYGYKKEQKKKKKK